MILKNVLDRTDSIAVLVIFVMHKIIYSMRKKCDFQFRFAFDLFDCVP